MKIEDLKSKLRKRINPVAMKSLFRKFRNLMTSQKKDSKLNE